MAARGPTTTAPRSPTSVTHSSAAISSRQGHFRCRKRTRTRRTPRPVARESVADADQNVARLGIAHGRIRVFGKEEALLDAPLDELLDGFHVAVVALVQLLERGSRIA